VRRSAALLAGLFFARSPSVRKWSACVAAFTAVMLGAGYCVSAASPFAVGALRDATGSFADALWLLVATAAGMLVVCATLSGERLLPHAAATIAA
jgi:cyanate permease